MKNEDKIVIGSDHAGLELKEYIKEQLDILNIPYDDLGTYTSESTHYPITSGRVAKAVSLGKYKRGITICGSGIGASMAANRFKGVRAGLCVTAEMAKLTRLHNNANVLAMGGRITTKEVALDILKTFLNTEYEGGRHDIRVKLIDEVATMDDL